ncbi:tryptophan synthase subunit alpha [Sediminibacterium sp. C3]|uniref:tryptophan synthase subunit alpha n=1 Tax=Sediminibacterium sp. C3 TaxID=1267211 RepID=UPI00042052BE|nr:tryptophan synthase subunit alpha [Sediminibacterium sp. C3]
MSRLENIFQKKKKPVLNVYFTAGYPSLDSTLTVMEALAKNGVEIIELGMPYSDPLADGPTIQESSNKAINNGMTITKLFSQIEHCRKNSHLQETGIVLMGYMNPILQYGFERFCADAANAGIDGLILPDLPAFEFENSYGAIIKKYGLNFIFLVTPETTEERVRKLDNLSSGFLYAVSASATTGGDTDFDKVNGYLRRLASYQLNNPVMVGFGIKDRQSFEAVTQYSHGAIIGSAYIKILSEAADIDEATTLFISGIRPKL